MHKNILIVASKASQKEKLFIDISKKLLGRGDQYSIKKTVAVSQIRNINPSTVIIYEQDETALEQCKKLRKEYSNQIVVILKEFNLHYENMLYQTGVSEVIYNGLTEVTAYRLINRISGSETIEHNHVVSYQGLSLCTISGKLKFENTEISISRKENMLLSLLIKSKGECVSKNILFRKIRGYEFDGESRSVDLIVSRLRKKLKKITSHITINTIRGYGYQIN